MSDRLGRLINFLYHHHFIRYVFVGGTTFFIDFLLLFLLHGLLNIHLVIAASIAYWSSILYNFTLNRSWTFDIKEKEGIKKHAAYYAALLAFNYIFTIVFVSIASHFMHYGIAKALAVGIQISWTYLIYKKYIFR